jgi:predicted GNAT family acetyltransferase
MGVIVRVAVADELRAGRDIRLRALVQDPTAFGSSFAREELFDELSWRQRIETSHWVLAWIGEEPVGLVAGVINSESNDHELVGMWVEPEQRGTGVATVLVDSISTWAKRLSARSLILWVVVENVRARRFYERLGFRGTGDYAKLPSHPDPAEEKMSVQLR